MSLKKVQYIKIGSFYGVKSTGDKSSLTQGDLDYLKARVDLKSVASPVNLESEDQRFEWQLFVDGVRLQIGESHHYSSEPKIELVISRTDLVHTYQDEVVFSSEYGKERDDLYKKVQNKEDYNLEDFKIDDFEFADERDKKRFIDLESNFKQDIVVNEIYRAEFTPNWRRPLSQQDLTEGMVSLCDSKGDHFSPLVKVEWKTIVAQFAKDLTCRFFDGDKTMTIKSRVCNLRGKLDLEIYKEGERFRRSSDWTLNWSIYSTDTLINIEVMCEELYLKMEESVRLYIEKQKELSKVRYHSVFGAMEEFFKKIENVEVKQKSQDDFDEAISFIRDLQDSLEKQLIIDSKEGE